MIEEMKIRYDAQDIYGGNKYHCCNRKGKGSCMELIIAILAALFIGIIGVIIGAALSATILAALAAVIVLAVALFIMLVLSIILAICQKCKNKKTIL